MTEKEGDTSKKNTYSRKKNSRRTFRKRRPFVGYQCFPKTKALVAQGDYIIMPEQADDDFYYVVADESLGEELSREHPIEHKCAWCLREANIPMQSETHGICAFHAEDQYRRYRKKREG